MPRRKEQGPTCRAHASDQSTAAAQPPVNQVRADCTWNFGVDTTVPLHRAVRREQCVGERERRVRIVPGGHDLAGAAAAQQEHADGCVVDRQLVVLSAWPVHGVAPEMRPHVPPPVNDVDVMLTMPEGVIVPVKVAVQLALMEPLDSVVAPVTENGSPFGFIG